MATSLWAYLYSPSVGRAAWNSRNLPPGTSHDVLRNAAFSIHIVVDSIQTFNSGRNNDPPTVVRESFRRARLLRSQSNQHASNASGARQRRVPPQDSPNYSEHARVAFDSGIARPVSFGGLA